jgi:hypothetical protein
MEHFGARVLYRSGKANVLADYLSRPPENAHAADENEKQKQKQIKRPEQLNRVNLQAIYEHFAISEPLPPIISENWMRKYFTIHDNELHMVSKHSRDPGDFPHPAGITTEATILLRIPEYGELEQAARNAHHTLGHGSIGAMQRQLAATF